MGDSLLSRAETVTGANFAAAEQRGVFAQLAGGINLDRATDAHAIDALAALHTHVEPVAACRLIVQQQAASFDPPVDQQQIEPAIAVVIAGGSSRHVDDFFVLENLAEKIGRSIDGQVVTVGEVVDRPGALLEARDAVANAKIAINQRIGFAIPKLDHAGVN